MIWERQDARLMSDAVVLPDGKYYMLMVLPRELQVEMLVKLNLRMERSTPLISFDLTAPKGKQWETLARAKIYFHAPLGPIVKKFIF
jgi:hypothetical protein